MKKLNTLLLAALMTLLMCAESGFEYNNPWDDKGTNYNPPAPIIITFTDSRDGKTYRKVAIGSQVWMAENLNYNASGSECGNETSGRYIENDVDCDKYGRLYDWTTAMAGASSSSLSPSGVQGVCPDGWHLPSGAEWTKLINIVGGASTAGMKLKSKSGWNNNGNGTDDFGFSALPGGYGNGYGTFYDVGNYGYWWRTAEFNARYAFYISMHYDDESVQGVYYEKTRLFSVRCVQDTGTQTLTTYTITFDENGGSGMPPDAQIVDAGSAIPLPNGSELTKKDYTFGGWNINTAGTGANYSAGDTYTPDSSIILYAKWNPIYTITFSANGGTVSPASGTTGADGKLVSLPTPKRTCYTFNDWYTSAVGDDTVTANTVFSSDVTVYARWTVISGCTTFTDNRDGKTYKKIAIGSQIWMGENLNYNASGSVCYGNDDAFCAQYGRLYNWSTAMGGASSSSLSSSGVQGACPVGWRLPSDAEWTTLTDYVGGASTAGTKLKSSTGWTSSISVPVGTDEYGFSALPGGHGYSGGSFSNAGNSGYWWSATETGANYARYRRMLYNSQYMDWYDDYRTSMYSVRCVADE